MRSSPAGAPVNQAPHRCADEALADGRRPGKVSVSKYHSHTELRLVSSCWCQPSLAGHTRKHWVSRVSRVKSKLFFCLSCVAVSFHHGPNFLGLCESQFCVKLLCCALLFIEGRGITEDCKHKDEKGVKLQKSKRGENSPIPASSDTLSLSSLIN